jgi:thiol:disulfide interchange protein DsbD
VSILREQTRPRLPHWQGSLARLLLAVLLSVALIAPPLAGAAPQRVDAVEVELVARDAAVVPGRPLEAALRIRHDPHWHSYWRNPGDSGLPTRLDWTLPEGWRAGEIRWPAPVRLLIGPLANYGYEGEVLLPVRLTVPERLAPGTVELLAQASWLVCKDVCIPGEASLRLRLPVLAAGVPPAAAHRAAIDATLAALPRPGPTVDAAVSDGRLMLLLPDEGARRAEFFPYESGRLAAAAPQELDRLGAGPQAGRLRLSMPLADGVEGAAWLATLGGGRALGVLRLDDRVTELVARAGGPVREPGERIASAVGRQLLADAATGASGLLGAARRAGEAAGGASGAANGPGSLALALVFGAIGGLILNLMPCVFPVVGLKVMGFAGRSPAQARLGAFAFAAGVLATFLLLGGLLLALRAAGQAAGWGFQLQSPAFVVALALLFVVLAANFAGVFEIGTALTRLGDRDARLAGQAREGGAGGLGAAFGSGALAVLVATPCTAPFMGSALGYTLDKPAAVVLAVFAAIAAGMALPYLVLGCLPALIARLPRPGRWMESLRQFMTFPMLASAAWLAWVLGQQAGIDAVLGLTMGAVLVALAAWIYGRFLPLGIVGARGVAAALLAVAALASGLWVAYAPLDDVPLKASTVPDPRPVAGDQPATGWQDWSRARVEQALARGQPVFVDFTAAWCVSCQANKRLALERESVREAFARAGVLLLRADWTQRDPVIADELARHGRNGVPLYLLFAPGKPQPRVLPELLTPGLVLEALAELR